MTTQADNDETTGLVAGSAAGDVITQPPLHQQPPRARLASLLALGLGICVSVTNIALVIRDWKYISFRGSSGSLLFALLILSLALGIFLIAYGVALGRARVSVENHHAQIGESTSRMRGQGFWSTSAVIAVVLGLVASGLTVWAAVTVDPTKRPAPAPKPCADLYQQALSIHEASENFRFSREDPDERRCDLNAFLKAVRT